MRRIAFAASAVALAAAALAVPLPWLRISPGPAFGTEELVQVSNAAVGGGDGRYVITSVRVDDASLVEAADALVDGSTDLVARSSLIPGGVDPDQSIRIQRQLFEEGTRLAWAIGAQAGGVDVTVEGAGAQVLAIADGVPADEVVEVGDVITAIADRPIRLAADVSSALATFSPGDEVEIEVERADERLSEVVELVGIGEMDEPGLGVMIRTVNRVIDMPFGVEVADVDVVGPSGGLMVALAAYDTVTEGSLAADRFIAGSGTIDVLGTVGPVGGVHQKVLAAIDANADIFLTPRANADEARAAAGDQLRVVAVDSLDSAIGTLASA